MGKLILILFLFVSGCISVNPFRSADTVGRCSKDCQKLGKSFNCGYDLYGREFCICVER